MKTHTAHGNVTKTAIGYVRVSAQEQATEGVSLDAQRDRLRSYCKLNGITGTHFNEIARQLNAEDIRAKRSGDWCGRIVSVVLQREAKYTIRSYKQSGPRAQRRHDKPAAAARARELREQKLSLRLIGVRLRKEGLVPLRGGKWHPASVAELLRYRDSGDRAGAAQRASELRDQGLTLREVGVRLAMEGHLPENGGA